MSRWILVSATAALVVISAAAIGVFAQASEDSPGAADMAAAMKAAARYTQPGKQHKFLERLVGTWDTETRFTMGGNVSPPEKGKSVTSWLMEGRWLKFEMSGTMMGMPIELFWLMGYDNFKQSFVVTSVSSMDTAMLRSEGDLDPNGKVLLTYGTLDEYLTGEHDKMVKSVWRFISADKIILEVHDLPIGEHNTKVFEITFIRTS